MTHPNLSPTQRILDVFRTKTYFKVLLLALFSVLTSYSSKATNPPYMDMTCSIIDPVTHHTWMKVNMSGNWWIYFHPIYGTFTFNVYSYNPLASGTGTPYLPAGAGPLEAGFPITRSKPNVDYFLLDLGVTSGPYVVTCTINNSATSPNPGITQYLTDGTTAPNSANYYKIIGDPPCDLPMPEGDQSVCYYSQIIDGVTKYFAVYTINDPTVILYGDVKGWIPKFNIPTTGAPGTAFTTAPISAVSNYTTSTTLTYDITWFINAYPPTYPPDCYARASVYYYDSRGLPVGGWSDVMCKCETPPCDADFTVQMIPNNSTMASLSFAPYYSGHPYSETWVVTAAGGISTTYPSAISIRVPYGTYTICHTLFSTETESCTVCKTVCCSTDIQRDAAKGPNVNPCSAFFTPSLIPYNSTYAHLNLSSSIPSGATETYTVTSSLPVSVIYSGPGNRTLTVPYGSYTICHTVTLDNGSSCTMCVNECLQDGRDAGNGGDKAKLAQTTTSNALNQFANVYPNPANDLINIRVASEGNETVDIVITDVTGRMIQQLIGQAAVQGTNQYKLPIGMLTSGMYHVRVSTPTHNYTTKLSVVK